MSELMRELQEDMQRERWASLWRKYGNTIISACIVVVIGTAAGVTYRHWKEGRDRELTSQLLSGIEQAKKGDTTALAKLADGKSTGLYGIAALYHAQALVAQGKTKEAADYLTSLKGSGSDPHASLAALHGAALSGQAPDTKNNPFQFTARELTGWQTLEAGKKEEAAKIFAALSQDEEAPATLRERARLVLTVLDPAAAKPAPTATAVQENEVDE